MRKAGGRLFVDITHNLASPDSRETLLDAMGQHDPLMKDALMTIIERNFIKLMPNYKQKRVSAKVITGYRLRIFNHKSKTIRQSFLI